MKRQLVTIAVVAALVLTGCLSGSGPASPTDGESPTLPPGVADGTLTNATTLAEANDAALARSGFVARTNQTFGSEGSFDGRLVASPDLSTYELSSTYRSGGQAIDFDVWGNESVDVLRTGNDTETSYRAITSQYDAREPLPSFEMYLQAGNFSVVEEREDGRLELATDEYAPGGANDPFQNVRSYEARVAVDEQGVIHSMTASVQADDGSGTLTYQLDRTGTERVDPPAWLSAVPESAYLDVRTSVDVRDESLLAVESTGTDPLPAGSTLSVTFNGTSYSATFDAALEPGDSRFAYVTADGTALVLADENPGSDDVIPLESPVSVTVTTADGTTVHSGSMGWDSSSAGESGSGGSESGGGSGSASGDSAGSASGGSSGSASEES